MAFDLTTAKPVGGFDLSTAKAADEPSHADKLVAHPLTRAALGAASIITGPFQLGANIGDKIVEATGGNPIVGKYVNEQLAALEAMKRRGGHTGFDWAGLAGNLATGAGAVKNLPHAISTAGRAAQGTAVGAGMGAITPTTEGNDFVMDKAAQIGMGAATGGVVPIGVQSAKGLFGLGRDLIEPFSKAGRTAILNRYQDSMIGSQAAQDKIRDVLLKTRTLVPESRLTAGETIADVPESTGLAAFQKYIAAKEGLSPEFTARAAQNEAARAKAIGAIAQTPAALERAVEKRAAEAAHKYGAAGQEIVTGDAALHELLQRPSMKHILSRAKDLAKEKGEEFVAKADTPEQSITKSIRGSHGELLTETVAATPAQYPVKSLHYIKMAMDDLLKNPERFSIGASEAHAIGGTKAKFLEWLGSKSQAYHEAREAFASASQPINQMEVGQQLEKALTNALETQERSTVFANAIRNAPQTIKTATGRPLYGEGKLSDVLTPEQLQSVTAVAKELSLRDAFQRLASKTRLAGGPSPQPFQGESPLPNLIDWKIALANKLLRGFGKHSAEEAINRMAANRFLYPDQLAASLQSVPSNPRYQVADALLQRYGPLIAGMGAARSTP